METELETTTPELLAKVLANGTADLTSTEVKILQQILRDFQEQSSSPKQEQNSSEIFKKKLSVSADSTSDSISTDSDSSSDSDTSDTSITSTEDFYEGYNAALDIPPHKVPKSKKREHKIDIPLFVKKDNKDPIAFIHKLEMLAPSSGYTKKRMIVAVIKHVDSECQDIIGVTKYARGGGSYTKFRKWFLHKFSNEEDKIRAVTAAEQFNPVGLTLNESHIQFTLLLRRTGANITSKRARQLYKLKTPIQMLRALKEKPKKLYLFMKKIEKVSKKWQRGSTPYRIKLEDIALDYIPKYSIKKVTDQQDPTSNDKRPPRVTPSPSTSNVPLKTPQQEQDTKSPAPKSAPTDKPRKYCYYSNKEKLSFKAFFHDILVSGSSVTTEDYLTRSFLISWFPTGNCLVLPQNPTGNIFPLQHTRNLGHHLLTIRNPAWKGWKLEHLYRNL